MLVLQLRIPALLFQQVLQHVRDSLLVTTAIASICQSCPDFGLGLFTYKKGDG